MESEDLPPIGSEPVRHVLAICGGGYAGLFAAEILRRLEAHMGRPISEVFDLVAGTSIGGILAIGLADGEKASDLSTLLEGTGSHLFAGRGPGIFRAKHDVSPLVDRLEKVLGNRTLSQLKTRVLVPSVDLSSGRTVIFGNSKGDPHRSRRAMDVALATSAAPYYLKPFVIDERMYVDGGLVANSPEGIAAVHAIHRYHWDAARTRMLVVGSTQKSARVPGNMLTKEWGLQTWFRGGRFLNAMTRGQMSLARELSTAMLGEDAVLSIDVELSKEEEKTIKLDRASSQATQDLKTLAASQFAEFEKGNLAYLSSLKLHTKGGIAR